MKIGRKVNQKEVRDQAKVIKDLKKELQYKEKALTTNRLKLLTH